MPIDKILTTRGQSLGHNLAGHRTLYGDEANHEKAHSMQIMLGLFAVGDSACDFLADLSYFLTFRRMSAKAQQQVDVVFADRAFV